MRTCLPLAGLSTTPAFTRLYLDDYARVASWYDYDPQSPDALSLRLHELDAREWGDLTPSAELAAAQQERWGAGPAAVAAARSLAAPGTYMVVTGQQAGLFGGPLYSQLKALTAILLARRLAGQFPGKRFVPVFWVASADSDYEEVRRTWLASSTGDLHEIALPPGARSQEAQALFARAPGPALPAALAELAARLPSGLYREEVLDAIHTAYAPEDRAPGSLARGFARWLTHLFRGTELVVLDPEELLAARPDVGQLYAAQLRLAAAAEAAVGERDAQLRRAGLAPQAELAAGDSQVFHVDEHGFRDKLFLHASGGFVGKRSGQYWSCEEAAILAEKLPGRFTGSVLFRPLIEDALFPCAAWIGGSAELAYRAQSTALFALHCRRHAPAYLRHHATLLPRSCTDALAAAGYGFADLPRAVQEWRRQLAARAAPAALRALLEEYRDAALHADALASRLPQYLPELERASRTLHGKQQWHLRRVERKVNAAMLRREQAETRLLLSAQALAFPSGKPQERQLSLLSFLPRTGFALIPRLLEELDIPCREHCLIMFD